MPWAGEIGAAIAEHSARHDRDGTFVAEAFDLCGRPGTWRCPFPGGSVAMAPPWPSQLVLQRTWPPRVDGPGLLASSTSWPRTPTAGATVRRRGADAEACANEAIVVVSTGGTDGAFPSGTAVRVDDGWRVSGRKTFASQAPVGDVVAAPGSRPRARASGGPRHGHPPRRPGVEMVETWDTLGMRPRPTISSSPTCSWPTSRSLTPPALR